jgi:RNA 3'-terminal phosphate cyclase (ATP)
MKSAKEKAAVTIDGSFGEGGGQMLRTSLALSMVTGKPFSMENIRVKREKPGLMRQHLTSVKAAQEVCGAKVEGAELGSLALKFSPGPVKAGNYHFPIGTAGSTTLVFQTVLPALMLAEGESRVSLEGGTHNEMAPPFEFLKESFLPLLAVMGVEVELFLQAHGFYPVGGGKLHAIVHPAKGLKPLELLERGPLKGRAGVAVHSRIPQDIAARELIMLRSLMDFTPEELKSQEAPKGPGAGNVVYIRLDYEKVTEVFTGFGKRGRPAEEVCRTAVDQARAYLAGSAPVGSHLADQLLIPMALAGGGVFNTFPLSQHSRTNMEVIGKFLPVEFEVKEAELTTIQVTKGKEG